MGVRSLRNGLDLGLERAPTGSDVHGSPNQTAKSEIPRPERKAGRRAQKMVTTILKMGTVMSESMVERETTRMAKGASDLW